ncbi:MAG: hypothetical protein OHK0028_12800 [Deltaproteobacteria bacterium]
MTRERLYLAASVGWVVLTLTLTSIPNPEFGPNFPGADKIAHFGFYGVGGFLFVLWRRESGKGAIGAALWAVALAALLGGIDEFHQRWIPGRSMEFLDWIADFAGGSAGALGATLASSLLPFLVTRKNQPAPRAVTD